jgi:outer membrane protein TolC
MKKLLAGICLLFSIQVVFANDAYSGLSLEKAVLVATENDGWIKSSKLVESAYRDEAVSHSSLPDPTLSLGFANLPSGNFDFNQENMTQFKVGFTQRFPGGDSLEVKSRKSLLLADINPHMRANRTAHLSMIVSHLWLDSFLALKSISLIESDRYLFEQLVEITTSRYQSAMGKARQQDVVRAQLELTKLEDRLTNLRMNYDINRQLLAEWLPFDNQFQPLFEQLPQLIDMSELSVVSIQHAIRKHPQLLISDSNIGIRQAEIDLVKEEYIPDWALNVSYGYREDSPSGLERDDFVSLGVSFDLPLFTSNRQDRSLSAAYARKESIAIEYELLEKKMR